MPNLSKLQTWLLWESIRLYLWRRMGWTSMSRRSVFSSFVYDITIFLDLTYCAKRNPCLNGGTCSMSSNRSVICTCPAGYTGAFCETRITNCAMKPCWNGGKCVQVTLYYWLLDYLKFRLLCCMILNVNVPKELQEDFARSLLNCARKSRVWMEQLVFN